MENSITPWRERENDTNITWTPLARVYIDFQIWYCCSTGVISDESDCCVCYHANQPSLATYIRIGTSPIIYCNLLRMAIASSRAGRVLARPNFRRSNLHMRFLLAMRGRLCELFIQNCTFYITMVDNCGWECWGTKKRGNTEVWWWFLIRGEETVREQEWVNIENSTSWKLECCYQPVSASATHDLIGEGDIAHTTIH